jgi:hypothetical protein
MQRVYDEKQMAHLCTRNCACKIDLNMAAAALAEASRLLSVSILSGSSETIELRFARVTAEKVKTNGALAAYRDHFTEA